MATATVSHVQHVVAWMVAPEQTSALSLVFPPLPETSTTPCAFPSTDASASDQSATSSSEGESSSSDPDCDDEQMEELDSVATKKNIYLGFPAGPEDSGDRCQKTLSRSSPSSAVAFHQQHCSKKTKKSHDTIDFVNDDQSSVASVASAEVNCDSFRSSLCLSSSPIHHHQQQQQHSPVMEFQFLVKLLDRTHSLCFPVWRPPMMGDSSAGAGVRSMSTFSLPSAWQICAVLSAKTNIPIHLLQLDDEHMPYREMRQALFHSQTTTEATRAALPLTPPSIMSIGGDDQPYNGESSSNSNTSSNSCHVFFLTAKLKLHIRGGKGGFGSLLKGQSKQAAAKTTLDFGACRDLSGRRLRHINDEIKLRKWREAMAAKSRGETINEEDHYKTKSGVENWYLDLPNWAMEAFSNKARRSNERRIRRDVSQRARKEEQQRLEEEARQATRYRAIMAYANDALMPADGSAMEDAIAQGMAKRRKKMLTNSNASESIDTTQNTANFGKAAPPIDKDTETIFQTQASAEVATKSGKEVGECKTNDVATPEDVIKEITEVKRMWFCALSGDFVTADTKISGSDSTPLSASSKHKSEILIQAKSDFSTGCILLPDSSSSWSSSISNGCFVRGKWYYEVKLQETAGMAQIGWADDLFEPNCEAGDGVGDDSHSYGYDGSRGLIFHGTSIEEADGKGTAAANTDQTTSSHNSFGPTTPWKASDVIGCMFNADDGYISFSLNGKDMGLAFKHNQSRGDNKSATEMRGLFPALSLNQKEIVLIRAGPGFEYIPDVSERRDCLSATRAVFV
jgi:hypothetical protein